MEAGGGFDYAPSRRNTVKLKLDEADALFLERLAHERRISQADVVSQALGLAMFVRECHLEGSEILVRNRDGVARRVEFD